LCNCESEFPQCCCDEEGHWVRVPFVGKKKVEYGASVDIAAAALARLLRDAGYEAPASAAEARLSPVALTEGKRQDVVATYRVRRQTQLAVGRLDLAAQLADFVNALEAHDNEVILGCSVSDDDHVYHVWLDRRAHEILAIVTPPRLRSDDLDDGWT
jgi:hypothetical protein